MTPTPEFLRELREKAANPFRSFDDGEAIANALPALLDEIERLEKHNAIHGQDYINMSETMRGQDREIGRLRDEAAALRKERDELKAMIEAGKSKRVDRWEPVGSISAGDTDDD